MKPILLTILIILGSSTAHGYGQDKAMHFGVSLVGTQVLYAMTPETMSKSDRMAWAIVTMALVGFAKELTDSTGFDSGDLLFNSAGIFIGGIILKW